LKNCIVYEIITNVTDKDLIKRKLSRLLCILFD